MLGAVNAILFGRDVGSHSRVFIFSHDGERVVWVVVGWLSRGLIAGIIQLICAHISVN